MITDTEYKKMYWHSRRGMLELDLLLVPYVQQYLRAASKEEQGLYQLLLEEEDQDLFNWLLRKESAPSEKLRKMVNIILESHSIVD